ncbi:ABC transporter ATP-binding protein [Sedimentitalea sp.]|uniref:ABC transporter ATP-binding protein n=1 Tax=Sedimentitalea sp. TaxID=2048915 RepID=UPI00329738FA
MKLLEVTDLQVHFQTDRGVNRAVDGLSFAIDRGEALAIVGESGCGKSVTSMSILRLLPTPPGKIAGDIMFRGKDLSRNSEREMRRLRGGEISMIFQEPMLDLTSGALMLDGERIDGLAESSLKPFRKRLNIVFQDPFSSLNPRMTVEALVSEPLRSHGLVSSRAERHERVAELLETVGLSPDIMDRMPHQFSGGQRQRLCIARALASEPEFIICDEAVSALDVSVQAQIINLLMRLQRDLGHAILFISHDLAVVEHLSDRVAVMYLGRIMEIADRDTLFAAPCHPYTQALLSAVPLPDPMAHRDRVILKGEVPSPINPPSGCPFRTRCPIATELCARERPELVEFAPGQSVACHYPNTARD